MSKVKYKQVVRAAFDNFVMVNETLVKHFKDANPALVLGYFLSQDKWLEESKKLNKYGYFYCKADKLEEKFGFSRKVQNRLIKILVDNDLIEVFNSRIEGSTDISKVRHVKVLHENIYKMVTGQKVQKRYGKLFPQYLHDIEEALILFTKMRRGTYVRTTNDEIILKIALSSGLHPIIINQSIAEKFPRIQGKRITAKYLLTAYIPNIEELELAAIERASTPKVMPMLLKVS